jgi:hypothetical protein
LLKYFQLGGPIQCSRRLVILAFCLKERFKAWNIKILATSFWLEKERNVGCGKEMREERIKKKAKSYLLGY